MFPQSEQLEVRGESSELNDIRVCTLSHSQGDLDSDLNSTSLFVPSIDGSIDTYHALMSRGCAEPGHDRKGSYFRGGVAPGISGLAPGRSQG